MPASADPAGPTNYQSTIVDAEPEVAGIDAEIIGGDSFMLITVDSSSVVEVLGYRGEPYIRFLPGGVVEENDLSPTRYLNEDRYAEVDIPAEASPDAAPRWRQVASDGSYAWHDHRAHWMNPIAPPGKGPGDQILEGVVPLVVDGVEVDLTIVSVWQSPPSRFPALAGIVLGLVLAAGLLARATTQQAARGGAVVALVALVVGAVAYWSVPSETVPQVTLWLAPAVSLVVMLAVVRRGGTSAWQLWVSKNATTLVFVAAVILVAWAVLRWEWMWLAILPTSGPFWLDRFVTALALSGGIGIAVASLRSAFVRPARPAAQSA
jgi:hypothetical protein